LVVAQTRCAFIARSGCNLCETVTHGVSPVL
jgi:hypothetical protein